MTKTASGLSPATLSTAVERASTVAELADIVDYAQTAVTACKRTKASIEETNEYAVPALRAIVKAGALLADLERSKGGRPPETPATVAGVSPYRRALEEAELPERTAQHWQEAAAASKRLAAYLKEAKAAREVASWRGLLRSAETAVDPGGTKASTSVEWYTPGAYVEAARIVMGSIDLDPASSEIANDVVGAETYFTKDDEPDGLSQDWFGNVWLNPPYGKGSGLFTSKLVQEYAAGRVTAGVLLINAYGFDAAWFQPLWDWPLCFTDHRVEFYSPQRESGGPANGNVFAYLGRAPKRFADVFSQFGAIVRRWPE